MTKKISLLLVDDHSVVRLGLKAYFNSLSDIVVIGEAASGEEAIQRAQELRPDVILMDLIMPGIGGVEATRAIKKVCPAAQVIVLTSYHEDEHIFPAIRAGALSYVLKDIDPDELADVVRHAYAGEAVLNSLVTARLVKELHGGKNGLNNPFQDLTERELEVLRFLALGKNNLEIAAELVISEKTVKTHLTNLLSKLHLENRTQAAVFAWQTGVVRRDLK